MSTDIITIQSLIIVDTNSDQNIPDLRMGAQLDKVLLKQKTNSSQETIRTNENNTSSQGNFK